MRYRYIVADVFTDRAFGGNPLAVLTDARGLSADSMQSIAREFNLAETVFVLPPEDEAHFRKVRIFTPATELPFAGHPTVGTACVLAALGQAPLREGRGHIVLEEGIGPVAVDIRHDGRAAPWARLNLTQPAEQHAAEALPRERIAAMLSLGATDMSSAAPFFGSSGVRFLFVPLASTEAVSRARLRLDLLDALLDGAWSQNVHIYGPADGTADFRARMFAPKMGVPEDPATGAASAALAGCLAMQDANPQGSYRWRIEQGVEMGRPSLMEAEADKSAGRVSAIRVGGHAVLVAEGTLRLGG